MQSSQPKPKRPVGVTVVAIVAAAGGLLSLFAGASVLSDMSTGPLPLAVIVIIFGVLGLALGAGLYTGTGWAWTAGIMVYIISIGLGVGEILYGGAVGGVGGIIRILAGITIPLYLTRQSPRSFFGKSSAATSPHSRQL